MYLCLIHVSNSYTISFQKINDLLNHPDSDEKPEVVLSTTSQKKTPPVWHEIKSDDGSSYFWNTITNGNT